jgi:hypothetical protein
METDMSTIQPDEGAIREQAYLLWEAEGRPDGRSNEYWQRAKVKVSEKSQMDTLVKGAPKASRNARAAAPTLAADKTKAAASKSKAAPAKLGKATPKKH